MNKEKIERLKAAGWSVGNASDFLQLTEQENEFMETKLALAKEVRALRCSKGLTQVDVARALGSSQSRIAKLEAADSSVSIDLMLKSLFLLGARRADVARAVSPKRTRRKRP